MAFELRDSRQWPMKPNVEGIEHAITSNEIFFLEERPNRIIVVGGSVYLSAVLFVSAVWRCALLRVCVACVRTRRGARR